MGEDMYFVRNVLKPGAELRNGTFLEIGAHDGLNGSNTLLLERQLGWTGVLIEANPEAYAALKQNRPLSQCFHAGVSTQGEGTLRFIGHNPCAGVVSMLSKSSGCNDGGDVYDVPARRLGDILHEAGITHIDYFSLDVEGAELEVLQSFDFRIPVFFMVVEIHRAQDEKERREEEQLRALLHSQGFIFIERLHINEYFYNPLYSGAHHYQDMAKRISLSQQGIPSEAECDAPLPAHEKPRCKPDV